MSEKKQSTLVPTRGTRDDPFALLRQMTSELDRAFDDWLSFRWPSFGQFATSEPAAWSPKIDVVERDNRLVARVDLPGMKKEELSVELTDGGESRRIARACDEPADPPPGIPTAPDSTPKGTLDR